jgi:DNA-binding NarL/FixJ family response regulator/signal transduction histidine kinase
MGRRTRERWPATLRVRAGDAACVVAARVIGGLAVGSVEAVRATSEAELAVGLVAALLLWWRRRAPVVLAVAAIGAAVVSPAAAGAALVGVFTVAVHRPIRVAATVAALYLLPGAIGVLLRTPPEAELRESAVAGVLFTLVALGWGVAARARRETVVALADRAARAEAEQQARIAEARQAERARIATEMHDVLAHRLSMLSLQAGAIELRPGAPAQELSDAARVIRSSAHQALDELRAVVGVLRDDDGPRLQPQPGTRDLHALFDEARDAGMQLTADVEVDLAAVPDDLGRHVYRIVQEGLTNARTHAAGQPVRVTRRRRRPRAHHRGGQPRDRHARARDADPRRAVGRPPRRLRAGRGPRTGGVGRWAHGPRGVVGRAPAPRPAAVAVMTGPPIRVVVVDDDPLVRAGLRLLLADDTIAVVGEAGDGAQALREVEVRRPDVVLMDIRMPGLDGLAATEALRSRDDPPEVLVLTTFDADEHVLRALRAGAAGFLLKDTPPTEIVAAVRRVAAGDAQLSPSVTRRLIASVTASTARSDDARARLGRLTDRERAVAESIGEGLTNADIAARLHLSVPTVKAHVSAILDKLGATNRVQVAITVHDAGT